MSSAARPALVSSRRTGLRVVHLVSSLEVGGMEYFVLRLAAAQQREGLDAAILAMRGGPLLAAAEARGVPVETLAGASLPRRLARAAVLLARAAPHVLHAHNPTSLHYAVLGRMLTGTRVVMTYHGRGLRDARVPTALEWAQTDAVVAVSSSAAIQMERPHRRLEVIRNGIEPTAPLRTRQEVREELGLGDGPVALVVARLDQIKGHTVLLDALARLRDAGLPLTVLAAGDGPDRAALASRAEELGLGADRFRLLGSRDDVPDLLAAADFFVLPSLSEGLPLALLEAMAHGVPVIATGVGGIPEVVEDHRHGLLVRGGDSESLADAMALLAGDPELRQALGAAAALRAWQEFSLDRMARDYRRLYGELLQRDGWSLPPG